VSAAVGVRFAQLLPGSQAARACACACSFLPLTTNLPAFDFPMRALHF
jgi:hypothetical protein